MEVVGAVLITVNVGEEVVRAIASIHCSCGLLVLNNLIKIIIICWCMILLGEINIIDINIVSVNDSYLINQGYIFLLLCGRSQTRHQWIGPDGNKGTAVYINSHLYIIYSYSHTAVQSITTFINSSFTLTNDGERKLKEGLSVHDFRRQLFTYNVTESGSVQILLSYFDVEQERGFILPDSSIAGTYTCTSGDQSRAVSINLRSINPSPH